MIEKIMKAVKRGNKRRSRNITIGAVIGFLLSCTAVAGADEYLYIKDDSGIQFSTDSTNGTGGDWSGSNPYEDVGNVWNENTYVNNIALSGTDNGASGGGYGVKVEVGSEGVKFINNGAISAESTSSNAHGIDNVAGLKISLMNNGTISANGDKAYTSGVSNSGTIENLDNSGIIVSTTSDAIAGVLSHGIYNNTGIIDKLNNSGKIIGSSYGVINFTKGVGYAKIGILSNTGVIHGNYSALDNSSMESTIYAVNNYGTFIGKGSRTTSYGYGIWNMGPIVELNNIGVIYGIKKAIYNQGGTIDTANNYGILVNASDNLVYDGIINNMNNYGLVIRNEGVVIPITTGIGGEQDILFYDKDGKEVKRKMTIENKTDATGNTSFEGNQTNKILNVLKNTYKVTGLNAKVTGSIINAYGTAVVFEGKDKKLTLSGTIVNGGIEDSTKGIAISGSTNGDNLILQSGTVQYTNGSKGIQNTIVNGNIDMGDGDDTLTIGDGTIVNGTLDGGNGADTLNFGVSGTKSNSSESEGVRILHNITGFENMNINTNVTLFEKTIGTDGKETNLEVTGVESIKIGKDGNLILRIDGTNGNSHALSTGNTSGTIESDGGKLLLGLNGVGENTTIDIGMNLGDSMYGVENEDIIYGDKFTLDTTSALHSVEKVSGSNTEVKVTTKSKLPVSPDTPEDVNYEKLNKIYQSMRETNQVKEFNVTKTDESLASFSSYLHDLYAGNPYSYSSELSRKSVGMFRDIAVESQFKPELNKWLIMGGLTHVDGGTKDTYYGKGYYTYDIGSIDMDADTKITGAYMLGEYGVSDTLTYGVVIGGNKLKSDLSNGSKVDGDALYMGAYAKKYIGNLKVTGGLGLQYGDYDADRFAAGRGITETRSYSDNYNDMTYDIYLNGRYSHNIGENLFLEPYGTLSYTYVDQEGVDEGSKVLAIETDSKTFDYTAAKVGVDLKKVIPHEKGKSTLSAGVSYTRLLTGADEENITGRFKGGSDFDILVAHKNEHSIGLNAKYALELENGVLFDVKGSYNVERDSHNGSGKNRTKGEWIVGVGIGYKF